MNGSFTPTELHERIKIQLGLQDACIRDQSNETGFAEWLDSIQDSLPKPPSFEEWLKQKEDSI